MNIEGFETLAKVAEDNLTSTWKAKQVSLDRVVLLKELKPVLSERPEVLQNLINEARAVSQLKMPNIVHIYDIGKENGAYYFVLEHIEGSTVAERIRKSGKIPIKEALVITSAVSAIMAYVHENTGIIYRNISPKNILVDARGTIKLSDVGLTAATGILGEAANYFSPEQISGEELTAASDIYSLGCTLYHMITGKLPFAGLKDEEVRKLHATDTLTSPKQIIPSIPLGVLQLLEKLTMKDPSNRYSSWKEVSSELTKVSAGKIQLQKSGPSGESTIPASPKAAQPKLKLKPKTNLKKKPKTNQKLKVQPSSENTPTPQPAEAKQKKDTVPMAIQFPAWILLFVWWILLGYLRYPKDPPPARTQRLAIYSTTTTTTIRRRITKPKPKPKPKTKNNSVIKTDDDIIAETEAAKAAAEGSNPTKVKVDGVIANIAYALYQYDFTRAAALVKNELEYMQTYDVETKLTELANFLDKFESPTKLVEEGFSKKKGLPTTVVYNGVSRKVKIMAVSNQRVVVTIPPGNKPITFEINKLTPDEWARWIPPSSKPEINAIKHILYLNASDYENAAKYAKTSGVLSEYFEKRVQEIKENQETEEEPVVSFDDF